MQYVGMHLSSVTFTTATYTIISYYLLFITYTFVEKILFSNHDLNGGQ
jgi:hypothetical protein